MSIVKRGQNTVSANIPVQHRNVFRSLFVSLTLQLLSWWWLDFQNSKFENLKMFFSKFVESFLSYKEKIYIFEKVLKKSCRISNFENRTTTGRAIAILMIQIKIENATVLDRNIGTDCKEWAQGGQS